MLEQMEQTPHMIAQDMSPTAETHGNTLAPATYPWMTRTKLVAASQAKLPAKTNCVSGERAE